jgi:hypothetical protein
MAMTFGYLDGVAQQYFGQDQFFVGGADFAQLLAAGNANATSMDGGAWIQYSAMMGGDITRVVRVYPSAAQPIDSGVAEGI